MISLKHIGFFFLMLTGFWSGAQNQRIDSLKQALETQEQDTNRVNTLRRIGVAYRSYSKDTSIYYINLSLALAKEISNDWGISIGLYAKSVTYGMTGDYAIALSTLAECEEVATKIGDYNHIIYSNNARGIIYKRLGDYPASKSYYLKNIQLADSLQLSVELSSLYINLGILYDLMDEKEKALEAYKKALEVYKGDDLEGLRRNIQANIAVMEFNDKNYETALLLFLDGTKNDIDRIDLTNNYLNVGLCYMKLKNWKASEEYLQKGLSIARELSLTKEEIVAIRNFAELMFLQDKLDQAETYYEEALSLIEGYGQFRWKMEVHDLAFKIHQKQNRMADAIHHLQQSILYKDSLYNESKLKEIQNMELQDNVYVKNQEISQQQAQLFLLNEKIALENRRKLLLGVITILSIFSLGLLVMGYQRKIRSNSLLKQKNELISTQKRKIEDMNVQLEKRMLRAQMNPHFIFNSLNSIQHFITTNDKTSALTYLTKFSKLLRQVLESSIDLNVILEDEIKLLKIYVELEALRFDDSFSYEFKVDESLNTYEHEVPILLVQPYIENAIIHGLLPKEGTKQLRISFENSEEYIKCVIQDNGVGRDMNQSPTNKDHKSRGMSVTEQRIQALEKTNFQLVIVEDLMDGNTPAGTRVIVAIPKN